METQPTRPGFEFSCSCFEAWAISFIPLCTSSLCCINEYLAIYSGGYVWDNSLRAVTAAWLNTCQRSLVGVGFSSTRE